MGDDEEVERIMTTVHEIQTCFNVESMPGYLEIRERFEKSFESFEEKKKVQAVIAALKDELPEWQVANNPAFINAIAANVDEEALLEKRFIFLSVNPQAFV